MYISDSQHKHDKHLNYIKYISTFISSFKTGLLAGLPGCDLDRLQSVINAAARLTADHITPLLDDLHWLRIPQRIQYKLCVLVYQCVQGSAPSYLQNAVCRVASAESRRRLRSASSGDLIVPATPRRTTMGAGPRLRRRSTARLQQSAKIRRSS